MKVPLRIKYALKSIANVHRQGDLPNIFLFATPRGGSTWVMELIASQAGMKYYDEPFNIRRRNVARTGLFACWNSVMPDGADTELIVGYLKDLERGRYGHMNPAPFRRHYRLVTNRIVFKIHELEHLIDVLPVRCDGIAVNLLRHPVPTTLSRAMFPRLDMFLESPYYERVLGPTRSDEVRALAHGGDHLQRGIISWCYENLLALATPSKALVLTYEELVLNPLSSCDLLMDRLQLQDREALLRGFGRPSTNIRMSSSETRVAMSHPDERERRRRLVTRWQTAITREQATMVTRTMELFGLDAYRGTDAVPSKRYLHFADTAEAL